MAKKHSNELTGLEKGLFKIKKWRETEIDDLREKVDKRTQFTIDLLKDNHDKLKEFYLIGEFWIKGFRLTELKEYTNKRGNKSMKHYIGTKYLNPQPKSKEPTLINWKTYIDIGTIDLYDIDDDGMLQPNKEKFKRHEEERLECEENYAYQSDTDED